MFIAIETKTKRPEKKKKKNGEVLEGLSGSENVAWMKR